MNRPSIIVLDVDGILTDGTKLYDVNGDVVGKRFQDLDFTAIKAFKALHIPVIFLTSDPFNEGIADKRNVPYFRSRLSSGRIDKKHALGIIKYYYNIDAENVVYVADDVVDHPLLSRVGWPFCVKNSPNILKEYCVELACKSGDGVICQLLDWFVMRGILEYPSINKVIAVDAIEYRYHGKYVIYKITNIHNHKVYIGQTRQSPDVRWRTHINDAISARDTCPKLHHAMRLSGIPAFKFDIIETGDSESWANKREEYYIDLYDACNNGYNTLVTNVGFSNPMNNPESRQKVIDFVNSPEFKAKMNQLNSGSGNFMYGKKHSYDVCQQISKTKRKYIYTIYSPKGKKYTTDCLYEFCQKHGLDNGAMNRVVRNKANHHKGWTGCRESKNG